MITADVLLIGFGLAMIFLGLSGGNFSIKELQIPRMEGVSRTLATLSGIGSIILGIVFWNRSMPTSSITVPTPIREPVATAVPTEISLQSTPTSEWVTAKDRDEFSQFIVYANEAVATAHNTYETTGLYKYFGGDALDQELQYIEGLKASEIKSEEVLLAERSYLHEIRYNDGIYTVDTCEYWSQTWRDKAGNIVRYDSQGNLLDPNAVVLFPQTYSIEIVNGNRLITSISFHKTLAFCSTVTQ